MKAPQISPSRGSVLIGLVITITVFTTILWVALVPMTASSIFSQVGGNSAERAYYLAESGYRYARQIYRNAPVTDRDEALGDLHDQTYSLLDDAGSYKLEIYPFYFKLKTDPRGTNTLATELTGGVPPEWSWPLSPGRVKMGQGTSIYDYSSATISGRDVTFNLTGGPVAESFPAGTDVLHVASSSASDQTINRGDDLDISPDSTKGFPEHNGWVEIGGTVYVYRDNDTVANVLRGIEDPRQPTMTAVTVGANSAIALLKFARIESTGIHGEGTLEAKRKVLYHQPLEMSGQKVALPPDTFEDLSNWQPSALGQHEIQEVGGDNALKVTGTQAIGSVGDVGSLKALDWVSTPLDLGLAHRQAGYFLSYDTQVKVGWDPWPPPATSAAGLIFRLQDDTAEADTLGISLVKGGPGDQIPVALIPEADFPNLVLWQRVAGAYTRLAHRRYHGLLYNDAESGLDGWTAEGVGGLVGLWHASTRRPGKGSWSWYYGKESDGTYETIGQRNSGALVSPSIPLCNNASLAFSSWFYTESGLTFDKKKLQISPDGGVTWTDLLQISAAIHPPQTWQRSTVDLSSYAGQTVKLRFLFDTIDDIANDLEGWYIDDIVIVNQDPTLLLRLREAAAIQFSSGGTTGIATGDRVFQAGASGTVVETPILDAGSWAAGNAEGWMLLNNISGSFSVGPLSVAGKGENLATVDGFRPKDNYVWVYTANACQSGDPAAIASPTPLDEVRLANSRQTTGTPVLRWPPDDPEATTALDDHFTLVQWNAAVDASVVRLGSGKQQNAIIRTTTLTTPNSGVYVKPELALHTFGIGSTSIYFDDFGLQAEFSLPDFPAAIQE